MINHKSSIINRKSQSAFTLIELLIVVVIIGVLATVFMSNYLGVRQRANDSQRKSNLRQIQAALELYRYDQGIYPTSLPNCPTGAPTYLGDPTCTVTYMQKIPADPQGATYYNGGNYYYTAPGGTSYTLCSCLENANDSQGAANSTCGNPIAASFSPVVSSPPPRLGFFLRLANLIQESVNLGKKEVSSLFSKLASIPQTVFAAAVEMRVVSIVLDTTGPYYRGQPVLFHIAINNFGTSIASNVFTQSYVNRSIQPPCNTSPGPPPDGDAGTWVANYGPGETATLNSAFSAPTADGTYKLGIFTDWECIHAETNETDNWLTISYTVLGPPPPTPTPTPTPIPTPTPTPTLGPTSTPIPAPTSIPVPVCSSGKFFVLESQ